MELSVIVPVYNGEKTLPETLSSLISQTLRPDFFEVVVINDGSTDESLKISKSFEEIFTQKGISFRILSFENGGVGVCRNRGIRAAMGENILFLDADDRLTPDALEKALTIKKEKEADILLFDSVTLFPDQRTEPFPASPVEGGFLTLRDYMLSLPCPWNKIISRSLFTEKNLFFPEGILYEDLALIPALGSAAETIYYEKTPLHFYYQSENSIMRSPWSEKRLQIFKALSHLKNLTKENQIETEYLFFLHLYRSFAWDAFFARDCNALKKASRFMKENFPRWYQNPLVKEKATKKEIFVASLFHHRLFFLLKILKGRKK